MVNFTFVPQNNPDGRSRGVRTKRACRECRFKKRRCYHQHRSYASRSLDLDSRRYVGKRGIDDGDSKLHQSHPPSNKSACASSDAAPDSCHNRQDLTGSSNLTVPVQETRPIRRVETNTPESEQLPRFVGDLNPEARLLDEAASPGETQDISPGTVGVWVQPRPRNDCNPVGEVPATPISIHDYQSNEPGLLASDLIRTEDVLALSDLYFANIHPIIPLLNEQEYRQSLSQCSIPAALVHVVCLLAAKDHAAGPYLKLLESGETPQSVRTFCAQLHKSITAMIFGGPGLKKLTLIRILGLLSLHHEGCGGAEQASGHIALAVHHAQTLALHLHRPNDDDFELKRTFWCLWTLDRLNAAENSRPCIMNDMDIAIEPLTPTESKSVAFDIWFRIAKTLNKVIGLYRPTNEESITGIELEYAGFEQIVAEMEGWHLPPSTLATAILAHRLKTIKSLPVSTAPRLRQQLSAIQILRYMQDSDRLNSLHPIPIIVYAASLSLSVSYQQLRYSRLASDQEEAHYDFNTACKILQVLQQRWSAADAVASLAHRISVELENLPNLALLRVDRIEPNSNEIQCIDQAPETRTSCTKDMDSGGRSPNPSGASVQGDKQTSMWNAESFDLFGGMDNMSWMYLDAENPVSFDSLPYIDFGISCVNPQDSNKY